MRIDHDLSVRSLLAAVDEMAACANKLAAKVMWHLELVAHKLVIGRTDRVIWTGWCLVAVDCRLGMKNLTAALATIVRALEIYINII